MWAFFTFAHITPLYKSKMLSGIYIIVNTVTNQYYIGSAVNVKHRLAKHVKALANSEHYNRYLQNAWNKYGKDAFTFHILEYVDDKTKLIDREQYWFNSTDLSKRYNLCAIAGSPLGNKHSEETKRKIGIASVKFQLGRKLTDTHKANIALGMKRLGISPEKRAKMLQGLRRKTQKSGLTI